MNDISLLRLSVLDSEMAYREMGAPFRPRSRKTSPPSLTIARLVRFRGGVHFLQEDHPGAIGGGRPFIAEIEGRNSKSAA